LRGEIDLLLLGRDRLDRIGIERVLRDVVLQRLRIGIHLDHRPPPAPKRIRGSSMASARSERKMPTTVSTAMNIRNEPARYMSWERKAASRIGPVIGSDITTETTTEPEMSSGSRLPISAMNGLSEILSGYFSSRRNGGRPLARPVTTYCLLSSSSR